MDIKQKMDETLFAMATNDLWGRNGYKPSFKQVCEEIGIPMVAGGCGMCGDVDKKCNCDKIPKCNECEHHGVNYPHNGFADIYIYCSYPNPIPKFKPGNSIQRFRDYDNHGCKSVGYCFEEEFETFQSSVCPKSEYRG